MAQEVFYFLLLSFFMVLFAGAYGVGYTLGNIKGLPGVKFLSLLLGGLEVFCAILLLFSNLLSIPWKALILTCGFIYFFLPMWWVRFIKKFPSAD
jgi:hypothetical protein